jgi:CBS domain-containing protein
VGFVMREDIIGYLIDRDLLPRERVSNIMSTPVATIDAEEPVARARITMKGMEYPNYLL